MIILHQRISLALAAGQEEEGSIKRVVKQSKATISKKKDGEWCSTSTRYKVKYPKAQSE